MAVRQCGSRVAGGVYLELPLGASGYRVERFLVDPPQPLTFDLAAVGMAWLEREGVWHLLDWIGESHYPNVADFVTEVKAQGLSRRVSRSMDLTRLSPKSRLLTVHRRALVADPTPYYATDPRPTWLCPKGLAQHNPPTTPECCAGIWWHDLGDEAEAVLDMAVPYRTVDRTLTGGFTYRAFRRPDGVAPAYIAGIFAAFPIGRLVVIRDPAGGTHTATLEKLRGATLPIAMENE